MSRPMTYPMGDISAGETVTMPAANRGDAKRISRVKNPFFVFLHIFAIGKRKSL